MSTYINTYLSYIRTQEFVTKPQLRKRFSRSRAAIDNNIRLLLERGFIEECGIYQDGSSGRPAIMYRAINMKKRDREVIPEYAESELNLDSIKGDLVRLFESGWNPTYRTLEHALPQLFAALIDSSNSGANINVEDARLELQRYLKQLQTVLAVGQAVIKADGIYLDDPSVAKRIAEANPTINTKKN